MARIELDSSMVFEVRTGQRMAMPLNLVERIESVPAGKIEFAGGTAVLQHRGELLSLEDEGDVLRELGVAWGDGADATQVSTEALTVLICLRTGTHGIKRRGVVVRRVLDISAGTLLAEDTGEFAGRLAMVKDRVTTMHRQQASAMLREVA
jgi:two-component system chemotaxis sensor kinase CheA